MRRYVIVGGGVAGHRAAIELRRLDADSGITLIGSEPYLPYDRTPLTKAVLVDPQASAEIVLKDADTYGRQGIAYLPGTTVHALDPAGRRVHAGDHQFPYDALLLSTGSRPRRLPPTVETSSCQYIRTLADAAELNRRLVNGCRAVIIGGGFIGLEVAAAARLRGCAVTVVEAREAVMTRGTPPMVGAFMRELHESNGVHIECGQAVRAVERQADGSSAVILGNRTLSANIVICGLGVEPNVELAAAIGLEVQDGIVVDEMCRTRDSAIFAAGEVTRHPSGRSGQLRRIESWRVASDQPLVAAANMAGGSAAYRDAPWLWSDQYDVNLQILGDVVGAASYLFTGRLDQRKWSLIALDRQGLPVGVVAANNGRHISMLRRPITNGTPVPSALASECQPWDEHTLSDHELRRA